MTEQSLTPLLQQHFGFSAFRPGQKETIHHLLNGHSSIAVFPTGSGKSLCYQLTALQLPHLTLVVSPLLALIKDQLDFLKRKNIKAASIDSTLTPEEHQRVVTDMKSGEIKILMISVERFKNERFRNLIEQLPISLLVVDEAHCISEWGHNFRPDYLKLPDYRKALNIPTVLLLTATANRTVKRDMAAKFNITPEHIIQTGFYRANLNLHMRAVQAGEKNTALVSLLRQQQGAGIIYVTLQQSAESVAAFLQSQGSNAVAYHAGLKNEVRSTIQQNFMNNNVDIVVATIAFGMGVDKANIRFVVHYDLPKSIENYSQEIGRAGRDGATSNCYILAELSGLNTLENFVYGDTPELSSIEQVLKEIPQTEGEQWELQINPLSQQCNIRPLPLKTLLVQLELLGVIKARFSYYAEYKIKCLTAQDEIVNSFNGERQEFIQALFHATTFKKIWGVLNFDLLHQHYPVPRSRVLSALEYLQNKGLIELETRAMTENYQVNHATLKQPDLAQQLAAYFTQKEEAEIKRIAALIRFIQLDACLSHNLARYFDDQQAPERCGHCSVCQGNITKLQAIPAPPLPDQDSIGIMRAELQTKLETHNISEQLITRFLCGLTQPIFTKKKVKQLNGWASCESNRYKEVRDWVTAHR